MKKRNLLILSITTIIILTIPIVIFINQFEENKFNSKGYAGIVTGGEENQEHKYIKVYTVKDLQKALQEKKDVIIEIMNDLDLGYNKIQKDIEKDGTIVEHHKPKNHPILKETGVSKIKFSDVSNVTIFSKNNAKILHATIEFKNAYNINMYNLSFDELWEWDESGKYDENDWDCITIVSAEKLWIHNCTFGQSYDGTIDIKNGKAFTISSCSVKPNEDKTFFKAQIDYLEENMDKFNNYQILRTNYTQEEIEKAYDNQYKAFNIGAIENNPNNKDITITMHHNYFKNVKTRIPRLRSGKLHFYENTVDSTDLKNVKGNIYKSTDSGIPFTTRALTITENGQAFVENCLFINVQDPFRIDAYNQEVNQQNTGRIKIINCIDQNNNKNEKIDNEEIGDMNDFDILESIDYK